MEEEEAVWRRRARIAEHAAEKTGKKKQLQLTMIKSLMRFQNLRSSEKSETFSALKMQHTGR